MGLYPTPNYVVGHMGYLAFAQYAGARLVGPTTITDPPAWSGASTVLGPAPYPAWEDSHNLVPVDGSASGGLHLAIAPGGAREYTIRTTVDVCDASYFADTFHNVVRNRVTPEAAGLYKGLGLSAILFGVDSRFASADFEYQGIDAMVQSFGFTFSENRPVQFNVEWYPSCIIEAASGREATPPAAELLHWVHSTFTVGGVDYHNILSSVRGNHTNNIQRIGQRKQLVSGDEELAISRTNYDLIPGIENTTLGFEFNSKAPNNVRSIKNWDAITLRAEHPAFSYYSSRRYVQIVLTRTHTTRSGQPEATADRAMSWSTDGMTIGLSITEGTL